MKRNHGAHRRPDPKLSGLLAIAMASFGVAIAPPAIAQAECGSGRPPPGAANNDVTDAYGQPATLWITNTIVGIATAQGYGEAEIRSPSPLQRSALLIDAQQDGNHQIIVDTGREAILYTVSGCAITPVVDQQGASFRFDLGHRMGKGDGIGHRNVGSRLRLDNSRHHQLRRPDHAAGRGTGTLLTWTRLATSPARLEPRPADHESRHRISPLPASRVS